MSGTNNTLAPLAFGQFTDGATYSAVRMPDGRTRVRIDWGNPAKDTDQRAEFFFDKSVPIAEAIRRADLES